MASCVLAVAGVLDVGGVPALSGVLAVAGFLAVGGVPALSGVLAVGGVLVVGGVSAVFGVLSLLLLTFLMLVASPLYLTSLLKLHHFFALLHYTYFRLKYISCRTTAAGLNIFCYQTIGI